MNLEKEKQLKADKNFEGLLEYWKSKSIGVGGLSEKICRVSYYSGRLKSQEKIKNFIEENRGLISVFSDVDYFQLAEFLFRIGYVFPHLSDDDFSTLEKFYSNPKYFDLLEDILFDKEGLSRTLKKFDSSARQIRNDNFAEDFLIEVFNSAMYNQDNEDDEVHFYDRQKNAIMKMNFDDNRIINKVHFPIQFLTSFREFATSIDEVLGENIRKAYFEANIDEIIPGASYESILSIGFSPYYFDLFKEFVDKNEDEIDLPDEPINKLMKSISLKWLEKVNQL